MPGVQPAELWQETGRWEQVRPRAAALQGPPRARLLPAADARRGHHRHRAQRAQELPPAAGELLPDPDQVPRRAPPALRRDARRASSLMKDAYSFDIATRRPARRATTRCTRPTRAIFTRLGLKFRAVAADTGAIGGSASQEFQVIADTGEDAIVVLRRRRLRRQHRDGRGARRRRRRAAPATQPHDRRRRRPNAKTMRGRRAAARTCRRRQTVKSLVLRRRQRDGERRSGCCWCAATTS